jgi:phosphotransferase system enzyme I (PtsI)
MNASAVPRVKQVVRSVDSDVCVRFARRVMEQADPEQIGALLTGFGRSG